MCQHVFSLHIVEQSFRGTEDHAHIVAATIGGEGAVEGHALADRVARHVAIFWIRIGNSRNRLNSCPVVTRDIIQILEAVDIAGGFQ